MSRKIKKKHADDTNYQKLSKRIFRIEIAFSLSILFYILRSFKDFESKNIQINESLKETKKAFLPFTSTQILKHVEQQHDHSMIREEMALVKEIEDLSNNEQQSDIEGHEKKSLNKFSLPSRKHHFRSIDKNKKTVMNDDESLKSAGNSKYSDVAELKRKKPHKVEKYKQDLVINPSSKKSSQTVRENSIPSETVIYSFDNTDRILRGKDTRHLESISTCNDTLFEINIQLGDHSEGIGWSLFREGVLEFSHSYSLEEVNSNVTTSTCIEEGEYTFTIEDQNGLGICKSPPWCYELYTDGNLIIQGLPLNGVNRVSHSFDTNSHCVGGGSNLTLEILPHNFLGISWKIFQVNSNQEVSLQETSNVDTNATSFVTPCLLPGLYQITISNKEKDEPICEDGETCYRLLFDRGVIIQGENFSEKVTYVIAVGTDGDITYCGNDHLFFVDIRLDKWPGDTSLILSDVHNDSILLSRKYTQLDIWSREKIATCIESKKYKFSLFDSFKDGIKCDGESGCFEVYLDDQLIIDGPTFGGKELFYSIDPSSPCVVDYSFVIHSFFEIDVFESVFKLLDSSDSDKDISFHPYVDGSSNATSVHLACIAPGFYSFHIFLDEDSAPKCENDVCYTIFFDNKILSDGTEFIEDPSFDFIVTQDGAATERSCHKLPILLPSNPNMNNFFDGKTSRVFEVIQSLSSPESLQSGVSAQYKAACLLMHDDDGFDTEGPLDFIVERYALAVFLYATNQDDNVFTLMGKNVCDFDVSVKCLSGTGRITHIDFVFAGITGTIPSELGLLRELELVIIAGNQHLKGTIPTELGLLDNLIHLVLKDNDLNGTIPSELGNMLKLEQLSLDYNHLHGTIPSEIGQIEKLIILELDDNNLDGTIPTELCLCKQLILFELDLNRLYGAIPTFIGQLEYLEDLVLSDNYLTGTIPQQIGNMRNLRVLALQNNFFSSRVPDIFANFSQMENFDVSNNLLSGSIPDSLWDMDVAELDLVNNELSGSVPIDFCSKPNLKKVRVDDDSWFVKRPKVSCPCCDRKSNCFLWEPDVGVSHVRTCPVGNVQRFNFFSQYQITDKIAGTKYLNEPDLVDFDEAQVCLSPIGCYNIEIYADRSGEANNIWTTVDDINSNTIHNISLGDQCNAVDICGSTFDQDHPRRAGLNHIMQLIEFDDVTFNDPSSPKQQALCWLTTQDELFFNYSICDGTLLQRYVSATLFFQSPILANSITNELTVKHTCDWMNIKCDSNELFVEHLNFMGKGLGGTVMTEIGLLSRLKTINLSRNELSGTIDSSLYKYLFDLEVFDVGENLLGGNTPTSILSNPVFKHLNISNNRFAGSFSKDLIYSEDLEILDISNNILQGELPLALFDCHGLVHVDLSQNGFTGKIPKEIKNWKNVEVVNLYQNKFSGSIPVNMFELTKAEIFMLHSNKFTGSIPTQVGLLRNVKNITLNHNSLKGTIPAEFNELKQIRRLRLQDNDLTGIAPVLPHFSGLKAESDYTYITNCDVSYPLECESCTICCNVDGECQEKTRKLWPIWVEPLLYASLTPMIMACITFLYLKVMKRQNKFGFGGNRDPSPIRNEDSVYAFIFVEDKRAWIVCFTIYLLQFMSYGAFLVATDSRGLNSDKELNMKCRNDSLECVKSFFVNPFGWFLYFSIILLYFGNDFVTGTLQIVKAFQYGDIRLFISGFLLQCLTMVGLICSTLYTIAAAETNTDAMGYAVVLSFISEMDERAMAVLSRIFPEWIKYELEKIEQKFSEDHVIQGSPNPIPPPSFMECDEE